MAQTVAGEVIRRFRERIDDAVGLHRELLLAIHLKTHQAALESTLAEQFVLNAAVLSEVFLHDLLIAYLTMSPSAFAKRKKNSVQQSLRDKFGPEVVRLTQFDIPGSISPRQAQALADPKDFNITVDSATDLATRANFLLAARYAKRFTLDPENAEFLDFLIAMRNFLSHRSIAARTRLKAAMGGLNNTANAPLNAPFTNVAVYLKTRVPVAGEPRCLHIGQRLSTFASALG